MEGTLIPITKCKRSLTMYVPQEFSKRGLEWADSESTRIGVSGVQEGSLAAQGGLLGKLLYTIMISMCH